VSDAPQAAPDAGSERLIVRWRGLRVGPLLMIAAGLSFTLMVSFVKVARQELAVMDVVFWRGAVALPLAMLWAARTGWIPRQKVLLGLRVLFGFLAMSCYFFAAYGLEITDLSLLGKLQPLVIAVLAPFLLGKREGSGPILWVILGLGLLGTLILLAPELQVGSIYGLGALGATLFSGLSHITIRKLTETERPELIVLYFQGGITVIAGIVLGVSTGISLPPVHLWAPLAGVGVLAFVGQILMTHAYSADRAPVVATAGYTTPVWAVFIDIIAFGVIPGWNAFLGGAIVVGAGLWLVLRGK